MSESDLHPEDLLDRARSGQLSEDERALLDEHVAGCATCALELRVGFDFDRAGQPRSGDHALLASITAGALEELQDDASTREVDTGAARRASRSGAGRTPMRFLAAAAVLVVVVGAAAAATYVLPKLLRSDDSGEAQPAAPRRASQATRVELSVTDEDVAGVASDEEVEPVEMDPDPLPRSRKPERRKPVVEPEATPSAAELLARGNAARGRGENQEAARLYRLLQENYPQSREQRISRIALGRLMLDRLGNPAAALSEFEYYLARHPSGTLAEEARVGRALALGKLGRRTQERAAWQDLIENHPSSPHVGRAERRVDELGGGN